MTAVGDGKPHEDLANLGDNNAAIFKNRWGPLSTRGLFADPIIWRDLLRQAWRGDQAGLKKIQQWVNAYMTTGLEFTKGQIEMVPTEFLGTILVLFLRDYLMGRTAVCDNKDCHSPFFIKKRRTQRYCGNPRCTEQAQREYALNWWHRTGSKNRARTATIL